MNESIIEIRIDANPRALAVIQVYAPTSSSSDEALTETLITMNREDIIFVMDDFNAKVGRGQRIEDRNEEGDWGNSQ